MFKLFKSNLVYIILYKNRVKIYRLDTGKFIEKEARKLFSNTRVLWADFNEGENFVREILKELIDNWRTYRMLIHQVELLEGGLSEVEKRALIDSAGHLYAKEVYLLEGGNELSPREAILELEKLKEKKQKSKKK